MYMKCLVHQRGFKQKYPQFLFFHSVEVSLKTSSILSVSSSVLKSAKNSDDFISSEKSPINGLSKGFLRNLTKHLGHGGHTSFDYQALLRLKVKITDAISKNCYRFDLTASKK